MRRTISTASLFLLCQWCIAQDDADTSISIGELVTPDQLEVNKAASFIIPIQGSWENPFDRESFRVVATVTDPDGGRMSVPCYFMQPYEISNRKTKDIRANIKSVRIELPGTDWQANRDVTLLVDSVSLSNLKTGKRITLNNADAVNGWKAVSGQLALNTKNKVEGQASLALTVKTKGGDVSPGLVLDLGKGDWSQFDELEMSVQLDTNVEDCTLRVTLDSRPEGMHSDEFTSKTGTIVPGQWSQLKIRLPRATVSSEWKEYGEAQWRMRFFPRKAGEHRIRILAESPTNWAKSEEVVLNAAPSDAASLIRVSKRDGRYFETLDGKAFFPVGLNICWADPAQYEIYLRKLAAGGGNFVRLWMAPWNFDLEWTKVGSYNQEAAAKMDYVFELCEKYGLKILLCLDYHGALKEQESWPVNPYNAVNGGPCESPEQFFELFDAQQAYQSRLRYLIARYGGSPSLVAWELFNEVGLTDPYRFHKRSIMDWHQQMVAFLRTNDPYPRLISTSVAGLDEANSHVWRVGGLDFVQAHRYHRWRSFSKEASAAVADFSADGRPIMLSEFGLNQEAARNLDPQGMHIHNACWSAVTLGAAGTPMPWWWDHHIDPFNLFSRLKGVSSFVADVDFPGQKFKPYTEWSVETRGAPREYGTVFIQPDQTSFDSGPFNTPQEYRVNGDGSIEGPALRAETIHGITSNPRLHNPQVFHVNYPVDGSFGVVITEVSNFHPSELRIVLDGEVALKQAFEDHDEAAGSQYRYNKVYRINIPKGEHTIVVDNQGHDWIKVAYILENYRGSGSRSLEGYGIAGPDTALIWLTAQENVYYAAHWGIKTVPVRGATLKVGGLTNGRWTATIWNTVKGQVVSTSSFNGVRGEISLPTVSQDLAVKLVRSE